MTQAIPDAARCLRADNEQANAALAAANRECGRLEEEIARIRAELDAVNQGLAEAERRQTAEYAKFEFGRLEAELAAVKEWARDEYQESNTKLGSYNEKLRAERDAARQDAERCRNALDSCQSWIDRWTTHVGNCARGATCTCGRTAVLFEARAALQGATAAVPGGSVTLT